MGGDFNEIKTIGERLECTRRSVDMNDFYAFIDNMEGVEITMLGRKFTWSGCRESENWSRINRFVVDHEWLLKLDFKCWGLPQRISNHYPILLMKDCRD